MTVIPLFLKCGCDCGCLKENDIEHEQCNDCDNGIHYDEIRKKYLGYETGEYF